MTHSILEKIFVLSPKAVGDGSYSPSAVALKLATVDKTDYDGTVFDDAYAGDKFRVLMICTEEGRMTMKNGKTFSTGNHPVEMIVPMLHLINAGFEIDIVTPTGKPVAIEMWAMPEQDAAVQRLYESCRDKFEHPGSIAEFARAALLEPSPYVAIYLPGGHGALLGLPSNPDVGKILHWAHTLDLYFLAICHGPAVLLAATPQSDREPFIFSGYKMAAFPDAVDKQTPWLGYMPGQLPWKFGEKLQALGVTIVNTKVDGTCHIDRKLISGDSPLAANRFGKLAADTLLEQVNQYAMS